MSRTDPKTPAPEAVRAKSQKPATVSSTTLLGQAQELRIVHEGREYRLRRTQNGRLILTA